MTGLPLQPVELAPDAIMGPYPWVAGFMETVIAYPRMVTRIKAKFDIEGFYVRMSIYRLRNEHLILLGWRRQKNIAGR